MLDDTIAAITTALGASGVGIVRISGPDAAQIADRVFEGKNKIKLRARPKYTISYGTVYDENKTMVDEALALVMWKPHSFTGEDVIELQCHGGTVVLKKVLELILKAGARLAEPGEFSKRAFLNGRLDLAQAESIMDIITAKTETAVKMAMGNLKGDVSKHIKSISGDVLELIAYLEADIDFPEEDFIRLNEEEIMQRLTRIETQIKTILQTYQGGRIIREGLKTALVGRPNAGKSSLLNAFLQEERAIVTDIPGTTRDTIEECYNLGGIPLILIDTAGIRETHDKIERLGVARTKEIVTAADIILYVIDIKEGVKEEDNAFLSGLPQNKVIVLINKIDVYDNKVTEQKIRGQLTGYKVLFVSAQESTGIKQLEQVISQLFFENGSINTDELYLTNARQKERIEKALEALTSAKIGLLRHIPTDLIEIDMKQAWIYLGEVTGESVSEDVIDEVFSRFCLGK